MSAERDPAGQGREASQDEGGPVRFMRQVIGLDYRTRVNPTARRFGQALAQGTIVGHRCPRCRLVYVPPRGYCPLCVVETTDADEVEVADHGTVTSWTVLTPIQYHGQTEREDYALANVLLDGASGTVGQQRLVDVPLDRIRTGLRVQAVWAPEDERKGGAGERGYGFGAAITGWRPTGEPDRPVEEFADHVL